MLMPVGGYVHWIHVLAAAPCTTPQAWQQHYAAVRSERSHRHAPPVHRRPLSSPTATRPHRDTHHGSRPELFVFSDARLFWVTHVFWRVGVKPSCPFAPPPLPTVLRRLSRHAVHPLRCASSETASCTSCLRLLHATVPIPPLDTLEHASKRPTAARLAISRPAPPPQY